MWSQKGGPSQIVQKGGLAEKGGSLKGRVDIPLRPMND